MAKEKAALSIAEVAEVTGLSTRSAYRAIQNGKLVARKFGARTFILPHDLATFLNGCPRAASREQGPPR